MTEPAKLTINLDLCIRSGECYYNHPELFQRTSSGDPDLIVTDLTIDEQKQHAREAAQVCPAQAIRIDSN